MSRSAQIGVCVALCFLMVAEGQSGHFWCSVVFGMTAAGCAVCFLFGEKR